MPTISGNRSLRPQWDLPDEIRAIPISTLADSEPTLPIDKLINEVRRWQPVQVLRHVARRGQEEVEACKSLVEFIFSRLDVSLPPGVIAWKGKPGRPPSEKTFKIYERWLQLGQPKLNGPTLARAFFGQQEYRDAGKPGQKKKIDECRAAVVRVRKKLPEPD